MARVRRGVALLVPGLLALAGLAGGGAGLASAQSSNQMAPRVPEYLYARTCGYCHGHNVGPLIRGRRLPAAVVVAIVRSGNGAMPAFRPTEITDAELAALAAWIEQSQADPREHGQ